MKITRLQLGLLFLIAALYSSFGDDNYSLAGTRTGNSTDKVAFASSENPTTKVHTPRVVGYSTEVSASFTRPADTIAYASGDLVANNTTAVSVTPLTLAAARVNDASGIIRRVRLQKTGTSITNASFRVHFYKAALTITNGDNGAWLTTESGYLGSADVTMDRVFSDSSKGIGVANQGAEINFKPSTGTQNIYALIEVRGAYTPSSAEIFTLTVEVLQN